MNRLVIVTVPYYRSLTYESMDMCSLMAFWVPGQMQHVGQAHGIRGTALFCAWGAGRDQWGRSQASHHIVMLASQ